MGIADPEAALEKLREFLHLQQQADRYPMGEVPRELHAAIDHLALIVHESWCRAGSRPRKSPSDVG